MNARRLIASEEAKDGFYPTPPALAERLLSGIKWSYVENILEVMSKLDYYLAEPAKELPMLMTPTT